MAGGYLLSGREADPLAPDIHSWLDKRDGKRGDVLKRSIAAAAALAMLVLTPAAASAQVCVVGIFAAAIYVGAQEKRELTTKEAMTCGLSYMFDSKEEKSKKKPKKKKQPRTARKP